LKRTKTARSKQKALMVWQNLISSLNVEHLLKIVFGVKRWK
jgi:hypothetical protein